MHKDGKSYDDIANELNIPKNSVIRIVRQKVSEKEDIYFSSILRDSDWFWNIKMPPSWGMGVRRTYG
jgi:hypothetical protein